MKENIVKVHFPLQKIHWSEEKDENGRLKYTVEDKWVEFELPLYVKDKDNKTHWITAEEIESRLYVNSQLYMLLGIFLGGKEKWSTHDFNEHDWNVIDAYTTANMEENESARTNMDSCIEIIEYNVAMILGEDVHFW